MDEFNLSRFIAAQAQGVYASALAELQHGRKVGHWMWFIFPQLKGLGHSATSEYYGISNLDEAVAYLADAVLGARLMQCTETLLLLPGHSAEALLGYPDNLKLLSSLTLFEQAAGQDGTFTAALDKYYQGQRDQKTLALLRHAKA
ncbi:DUF1810 domain-containing protein [Pseudaeromonas sp. ZJS20]|uniref:DUF1810 domain-containing protein n=1 Tax=Pseudaeromonas aegiceratis TaxID=3153928 RepID=UPI00390CA582